MLNIYENFCSCIMKKLLDLVHEKLVNIKAATAGKAPKAWALIRFWVSIRSYKKQLVKKKWGRILGLAWLKFAVASLNILGGINIHGCQPSLEMAIYTHCTVAIR